MSIASNRADRLLPVIVSRGRPPGRHGRGSWTESAPEDCANCLCYNTSKNSPICLPLRFDRCSQHCTDTPALCCCPAFLYSCLIAAFLPAGESPDMSGRILANLSPIYCDHPSRGLAHPQTLSPRCQRPLHKQLLLLQLLLASLWCVSCRFPAGCC
jgi:hypothetical protein